MKILFLIASILFSYSSFAVYYRSQPGQIVEKVLGDNCRSFLRRNDSLPCNPAFTAQDQVGQFRGSIFGGHNFSYVEDARDLLNNEATDRSIEKIFSQERTSEGYSQYEFSYSASKWGIAASPTQIYVSTWFRNVAFPELSLIAIREQTYRFQLASYLDQNWSFGAQFRIVDRKFLVKDIYMTEFLFDNDPFQRPEKQQSFYFEPGFSYENPETTWHPQFSASIHQLGFNDKESDRLKIRPELNLGFSVQPPLASRTELGLNIRTRQEDESWDDLLRLAGTVRLINLEFLGGVSRNQYDIGFISTIGAVQTGLSYSVKDMPWNSDIKSYQTNAQFGFVY